MTTIEAAQQVTADRAQLKLTRIRAKHLWSRSELARRAGLDHRTVTRAETGETIELLTAQAILNALNTERVKMQEPELEIEDLDWIVQEL